MFSLDAFEREYDTKTEELKISGRELLLRLPRTIDRFVSPENPVDGFPLWAKIWQASIVLADVVSAMPVDPGREILEIGGGLGLVSIAARCCGHRITFSDSNADALQFARANALINNCPDLPVVALDWNSPRLDKNFDLILGSEISYRNEDIPPLTDLFRSRLKPKGQVILCGEMRKTSRLFWERMARYFDIAIQKKLLRDESDETRLYLFHMTFRRSE